MLAKKCLINLKNPENLSQDDKQLLALLMQKVECNDINLSFLEAGKSILLSETDETGMTTTCFELEFNHDILIRPKDTPSSHDELKSRIEIIDNRYFSNGGYGFVTRILATLYLDNGVINVENKSRLVKQQEKEFGKSVNELHETVNRESEFNKRTSYLHSKKPVFNNHEAFIVMKNLGRDNLYDFLRSHLGSLSADQRYRITINVLRALQEQVHHAHMIHADVKPENIIIDPNTLDVYFIDFGLADDSENPILKNKLRGTRNYIAPEAHSNIPLIITESDIYAIGKVISQIWASRTSSMPSSAATPLGLSINQQRSIIEFIREANSINPALRPKLSSAIKRFEREYLSYKLEQHSELSKQERTLFREANINARELRKELLKIKSNTNFTDNAALILNTIQTLVSSRDITSVNSELAVQEFIATLGIHAYRGMRSFNEIIEHTQKLFTTQNAITVKLIETNKELNQLALHLMSQIQLNHGIKIRPLLTQLEQLSTKLHRATTVDQMSKTLTKVTRILDRMHTEIQAIKQQLSNKKIGDKLIVSYVNLLGRYCGIASRETAGAATSVEQRKHRLPT